MKTLLTTALLLAGLNSLAQTTLKTDSVYISGYVSNYARHKDSANAVKFIINDFAFGKQLTYLAKIKDDGNYRTAFIKTGPQDIMMLYNEDLIGILVNPGDHMQIDFDADKFETSCLFKGDGAQANNNLKAYESARDIYNTAQYGGNRYARFRAQSASEKSSEPDAHKKFLAERYAKDQAFLNDYLKQHQAASVMKDGKRLPDLTTKTKLPPLSPTFIAWATADLKYEYMENLMRYAWLHPMSNKIKDEDFKLPANYYDFINKADLNNESLSVTAHFQGFLGEYGRYLANKELGKSKITKDVIELYLKQTPGYAKNVMLSQQFYGLVLSKNLELVKLYLDRYKANVTLPAYRNSVVKAYNEAVYKMNNYSMPVTAQINKMPLSEADSLFNKIVAKYPGKVVYVDFWAPWCGPCVGEMPNSKKLHAALAGKDVVFLYLGVQSPEKAWKASIAEMGIEGEHFLLSNNDFGAISAKFQISGIPRYILVDKKGRVYDENAKRPSDDKLKADIEKLLAAN